MLTTPVINDIKTFNATKESTITFNVVGGNQVIGNNLVVERVSDNSVVYNEMQDTFNFRHTISSNTLINGVNYRAKIRTKDINNNWSSYSRAILFWCFSEPILTTTTIDYSNQNRVYNQTVLFETTYIQNEGEILQSYRYLLYDSNRNIIRSFGEQFSNGSLPLTQEITGLNNGETYYLEVKTLSPNGNSGTTGLISFKPFYVAPRLSVAIETESVPNLGAIKINTNIIQTILRLYDDKGNQIPPNDVEYVFDDWIDMTRVDYAELVGDGSLNTSKSDFFMNIWCKKLPEDKVFLTFGSPYGKLEMLKRDNRIRVHKTINGLISKACYVSNELVVTQDEEIMIHMRQEDDRLDLYVGKLMT